MAPSRTKPSAPNSGGRSAREAQSIGKHERAGARTPGSALTCATDALRIELSSVRAICSGCGRDFAAGSLLRARFRRRDRSVSGLSDRFRSGGRFEDSVSRLRERLRFLAKTLRVFGRIGGERRLEIFADFPFFLVVAHAQRSR